MTGSWPTPSRLLLNADVGEIAARVHGDGEARLIALLDVANVACGGHAGDDDTMRLTLARCRDAGVVVVAHPGYPDREGFGRRRLSLSPDELRRSLLAQVGALAVHADDAGVDIAALKPHGALYHAVDDDDGTAAVLADVVDLLAATGRPRLPLVLAAAQRATSPSRRLLAARGVGVVGEVFVDRGVDGDGRLLPRGTPGALLSVAEATTTTRAFAALFRRQDRVDRHVERRVEQDGGQHGGQHGGQLGGHRIGHPAPGVARFATACVHGDGDEALAVAMAARVELDAVFGSRR